MFILKQSRDDSTSRIARISQSQSNGAPAQQQNDYRCPHGDSSWLIELCAGTEV
jgi:hypothetical protein